MTGKGVLKSQERGVQRDRKGGAINVGKGVQEIKALKDRQMGC
jgi:hypothetical protein